MKTRTHLAWFSLAVITALLLLAGPASAQGEVIQYWGDEKVNLPAPAGPDPVVTTLEDGRILTDGILSDACYVADEDVATDLISGCWSFVYSAIREPSGVMQVWGTATQVLDYFGKGCDEEGGGGWLGTFHGVLSANGDALVDGNNEGCGALEGWRMEHHEEWEGLDPDTGVYASRTFSGLFKPPGAMLPVTGGDLFPVRTLVAALSGVGWGLHCHRSH